MRKLLAASTLTAALLAGCNSSTDTDFTQSQGNPQKFGKVVVLLADPVTGQAHPSVQKELRFQGVDDERHVTFGPVTRPFGNQVVFDKVPLGTTGIEVYDPSNPRLFGEAEVVVRHGGTGYASDIILLPAREATAGLVAKDETAPIAVGAGFVQSQRSALGSPGSSPVMAAVDASSATSTLPFPYKTNSWLSPILWSDNHTPFYVGHQKQMNYQRAIYPKPWCIRLNQEGPNATDKGILFGPERVRSQGGAQIPSPDGFDAPYSSSRIAEIQGTFDTPPYEVKPGFLPLQMKVARMGDYDADLMLRAVDDPDFASTGLPTSAGLQMTVVRGNPILFFKTFDLPKVDIPYHFFGTPTNADGEIDLGNGVTVGYNVFTAQYPNYGTRSSVLFYRKGAATLKTTTNLDPATLTFQSGTGANYFSFVTLPPGQDGPDGALLQSLAEAAFAFPTDSKVTYSYNQGSQTVDATYKLETADVLGSGATAPISGLLPNHYAPGPAGETVLQAGPTDLGLSYVTVRGDLKVYQGDHWTSRFRYPGVLPWLPPLDGADTASLDKFKEWIAVFVRRHGSDSPPYTGINLEKGQQAYELGKFLGRNVLAAASIADVSPANATLASQITTETRNVLELSFRQNPTYLPGLKVPNDAAPYYTYYDPRVGSLNQYPNGTGPSAIFPADTDSLPYESYGAVTRGNDHHFHFGYYIFAAGEIGLRDPAWAAQWKDAINQYIFDVANQADVNPNPILSFPRMRNWDPYQNVCYAAGLSAPDAEGNNEESISEEINFWAGVILWGAATKQQALMEHGIKHYTAAVHSSWTYFFDPAGRTEALAQKTGLQGATNWPGQGAVRLFDGYTRWDTFFGLHPGFFRAIVMIPITPCSFYHALNTDYVGQVMSDYDANVQKFNIDPLNPKGHNAFDGLNQWISGPAHFYALFAKYAAMNDPTHALSRYFNVPANYDAVGTPPDNLIVPNDKFTDVGDSALFTFHWVQYMVQHGKPDPSVRATNTPFYQVFTDTANSKRTYAAFNPGDADTTVDFDDGGSLPVPAHKVASKTVSLP